MKAAYFAIRVAVASAIMFALYVTYGLGDVFQTFMMSSCAILASHAVAFGIQLVAGEKPKNMRAVYVLGGTVLLAAGALVFVTFDRGLPSGPLQYLRVDEVMTSPAKWRGREIKVHGYLEIGTMMRRPEDGAMRFLLVENKQKLSVEYTGVPPDTLKDRAEVVARGRLTTTPAGDLFIATEVMARCPSTYNTAEGPKPASQFR